MAGENEQKIRNRKRNSGEKISTRERRLKKKLIKYNNKKRQAEGE